MRDLLKVVLSLVLAMASGQALADLPIVLGEHEKPRGSHRMMPSTGVKITTIIS